ncbi:MAG: hypothetical protein CML20_22170 [Rheinheimera sp.]|uniref:hypothetical protein n=1 Tax=Arsukibacterium sp. UBA3155 TaxID=1946058 RepID=UPI000C98527B|nr:hypothetical protein [Arsukibacterium sp. UBA3155]MAD77441.1 hypothetical protein [Rheinheimera sp.]|tara:strand:+ start:2302 stop:2844 length:543 start_codon:yes stop_codon:yes gene_type:complete
MKQSAYPLWLPLAALLLAGIHLTYEQLSGGVQSHHLLNDATLPAISNWFELLTLPLLAAALGWYCQKQPAHLARWARVPRSILPGLFGAASYGAVLAISFSAGMLTLTSIIFFSLLLVALLFPVYRLQYICGFVMAMTFTFGGILPLLIAVPFALLSWILRSILAAVARLWRKKRAEKAV